MKREIEFRAWDKDMREMLQVSQIQFDEHSPMPVPGILDQRNDWHDMNEIELMQFAGLKDKNGKEIYEGDILRSGDGQGVSFIVWSLDGWRFNSWMPRTMDLYPHVDKTTDKEPATVIGNIYEHSHLLI